MSWCSKKDDVQNLENCISFEEEVFSPYGFPREYLSLCISYVWLMFFISAIHVLHNLDDHLEKGNNILIGIKLFKHSKN